MTNGGHRPTKTRSRIRLFPYKNKRRIALLNTALYNTKTCEKCGSYYRTHFNCFLCFKISVKTQDKNWTKFLIKK